MKAKQYESNVPHYGFTSVSGDITIGVVQDIPQFVEANYNQPPPSFSSIGGDVMCYLPVKSMQMDQM